jgi:hypothetical protein
MKTKDMILIAILATMGISIKPFISPLFNIITDLIFIPGGSSAGGIYMMFLTIGAVLINNEHVAIYIGIIQGLIALLMGISGFQGALAIIIYTAPGITIDFIVKFRSKFNYKLVVMVATALGNLTGSLMTNFIFFHLKLVPASLFLIFAILSGLLGGQLAFIITERIKKIYI